MSHDLMRRIAVTIGALLIYRLGSYIPLPGIDLAVLARLFGRAPSIPAPLINLGDPGIRYLAIFSLGITPYISAAILMRLATIVSRKLRTWETSSEMGRQRIQQYTLYLTVLLALAQGYGVATGIEQLSGVVADPSWMVRMAMAATLAGGALFLVWLSEQITLRGIGNGVALILFTGVAIDLWRPVAATLKAFNDGFISSDRLALVTLAMVVITVLVVVMERARQRVPIQYPARQLGDRTIAGQSSFLSFKLNSAGVIPVIAASWVLGILTFLTSLAGSGLVARIAKGLESRPVYLVLYALLIVLCAFLYTAFLIDPDATAATLKKHGGSVPSIEPGEATAAHIDQVVSRNTLLGAIYLAAACVLPAIFATLAGMPFGFGGIALLIAVCTSLDLENQTRSHVKFRCGDITVI